MLGVLAMCLSLLFFVQPSASRIECICVPLQECDANFTVIGSAKKTWMSPFENDQCNCFYNHKALGKPCKNPKKVCCRLSDTANDKLSWDVCGRVTEYTSEENVSQFPWMATIYNKNTRQLVCGGTIIAPRVILIAANCVRGEKQLEMVVRTGGPANSDIQERTPSRVIVHPYFHSVTSVYNVALMVLEQPLERTTSVAPICLPEPNSLYGNEKCLASAWSFSPLGDKATEKLVDEWLKILTRDECQASLRTLRADKRFLLDSSIMCTEGGNHINTCNLLGSGPLFCKENDRYVQAGIFNMAFDCRGKPPVQYANLALMKPWIWYEMQNRKLQP